MEFDNTINKDTKADAGKYKRKQQQTEKPAHTPVGLPEQEGGKRKKKKKWKNEDKEHNKQETEPGYGTVEEDTKPAINKQATEDQKDIPDSWDNDDNGSLGVLHGDDDTTHHEGCETGSQVDSQVNCAEHTEKDCDIDSNHFHEETDETVKVDIGTDYIEEHAAAEEQKNDERTVQNNFEVDDGKKGGDWFKVSQPVITSVIWVLLRKICILWHCGWWTLWSACASLSLKKSLATVECIVGGQNLVWEYNVILWMQRLIYAFSQISLRFPFRANSDVKFHYASHLGLIVVSNFTTLPI